MYFYVDESGHTGKNLFDPFQPILYYGVLSSRLNLDILALPYLQNIRKKLKVSRLHGVDLSQDKLVSIVPELLNIQKKFDLTFDFYRIFKADYALICFFDQVFDQGINPAVSWSTYWTPLRFAMLIKLASLFDDNALKMAWDARIELDPEKAQTQLIELCLLMMSRVPDLSDSRAEELINDALQWAHDHPREIHYNVTSKDDLKQVTPNMIGFQSVMLGIASRIVKRKKPASKIVIDQQSEFNKAQQTLRDYYLQLSNVKPMVIGPGLPEVNLKGMPIVPITFSASDESPGLELVDVYLWIFKRYMEKKSLPHEALSIIRCQMHRGVTDELSISALSKKWNKLFQERSNISEEDLKIAKDRLNMEEVIRRKAVKKSKD